MAKRTQGERVGVGRILPAPQNFLTPTETGQVEAGHRDFLRGAFLAAAGTLGAAAPGVSRAQGAGDPAILTLPAHSTSLGLPVAARPYGLPSRYEANLQRRQSPASPGWTPRPSRLRRSMASSGSSRPTGCTSSGTTRAGMTSTRPSTV
jgi:hypothetical protein